MKNDTPLERIRKLFEPKKSVTDFEAFWKCLSEKLNQRTKIANWTNHSQYIGEDFFVNFNPVRHTITTFLDNNKTPIEVPKSDMEFVFSRWDGYLNNTVKREYFRDNIRTSKYVISIIHQFKQ